MSSQIQLPVRLRWRIAEQAVLWLPAVLLAVCVAMTAHPMPFFDEWAYAENWLRLKETGEMPWQEIFRPHSVHWQPWPKLIVMTVCQWFGGDMRVMCWSGVALAAACVWMIWRLCLVPVRMSPGRLVAAAAMGLAMFSPGQSQTFVWGACFLVIIPVFSLVASIYILRKQSALPLRLGLCVLLSVFAAGSYGSGLIVWCAVVIHLFLSSDWIEPARSRWPWIAAYALHGVILTVCIMSGFEAESGVLAREAAAGAAPESTVSLPWFIAAVGGLHLGGGLSLPVPLSGVLGIVCGAGCAALFVIVCRSRNAAWRTRLSPWVTLAAFAGASAILIGWGRYTPAGGQLSETRYNTSCHFLSLSLLACGLLHWRFSLSWRLLIAGAAGAWFCLTHLTGIWGWQSMQMWRKLRLQDNACVHFLHTATDEALGQSFPGHVATLRSVAVRLEARDRLAGVSILPAGARTDLLSRAPSPLSAGRAAIPHIEVKDGKLRLEGHAFLPRKGRPADAVVISAMTDSGPPAEIKTVRVETAMEFDAIRALRFADLPALASWTAEIDLAALPPSARSLRVEAFDAETGRLHLLPPGFIAVDGTVVPFKARSSDKLPP